MRTLRLLALAVCLVCARASEDPVPAVLRLVEPETGPFWREDVTVSVAVDVGGASRLARDVREAPDSFSVCDGQRIGNGTQRRP